MAEVSTVNNGDDYPDISNQELIDAWMKYRNESGFQSTRTRELYTLATRDYGLWLSSYKEKNIIESTGQDIRDYRQHVLGMGLKNSSIALKLKPIRYILEWAEGSELIHKSPFPMMVIEEGSKHTAIIPCAKDIMSIRASQKFGSLTEAALFEVLVSSGLRRSEVIQLRCCDFQFSKKPFDFELNRPSPYVGAKIDVSSDSGILTKTRRTNGGKIRVTHVSALAAKLVKALIRQNKISESSALPVFPMVGGDVRNVMAKLSKGYRLIGAGNENKRVVRKAGFIDLQESEIEGVDPAYRERILRIKEAELKLQQDSSYREQEVRIEKGRKATIHAHALRHFFAVWQYYRNYHGNRHDLLLVRDMLGHTSIDTTDIYVTGETYIENDLQWKQIACGNGTEYLSFLRG